MIIWHFYVRYSYVVVEKEDIMTKKGKLRKGIGILLAVCMAIAIGKDLILSPPFPLLYTVRETFASYGVPSYICKLFIV